MTSEKGARLGKTTTYKGFDEFQKIVGRLRVFTNFR